MKISDRLSDQYSARTEFLEIFGIDLPIEGGWGYDLETVCVIDKRHPSVNQNLPFNGIAVERNFALHRIYMELIVARNNDNSYSGIEWHKGNQQLIERDGRMFDHLEGVASALRHEDREMLKERWNGPEGFGSPEFNEAEHRALHEELTLRFECEFWFDITSFYGN